jgi:CheY-like chemotaxis protein
MGLGLRVLQVDDDHGVADAQAMLIECLGANVRVAYDGKTALRLIPEFQPQLVILDIEMPDMNGCEMARRIRQMPEGKNIHLAALTGDSGARQRAAEAGVDHFFVKPIQLEDLERLLASSLSSGAAVAEPCPNDLAPRERGGTERQPQDAGSRPMPPAIVERHLKAAERHIVIGERCIARQRGVVSRLENDARHEELRREAFGLLAQFLKIQALHLADRDQLICKLDRGTTDRRIGKGQFRIANRRNIISSLENLGRDSQRAKNRLALLEGTQATLLAHRDRLDEMGAEDAEEMGWTQAAMLLTLRIGMAARAAQLDT